MMRFPCRTKSEPRPFAGPPQAASRRRSTTWPDQQLFDAIPGLPGAGKLDEAVVASKICAGITPQEKQHLKKEAIVPRSTHELHYPFETQPRPMIEPEIRHAMLERLAARVRPVSSGPASARQNRAP
jgi:hypothetical protein